MQHILYHHVLSVKIVLGDLFWNLKNKRCTWNIHHFLELQHQP